jgi:hypothetical protein
VPDLFDKRKFLSHAGGAGNQYHCMELRLMFLRMQNRMVFLHREEVCLHIRKGGVVQSAQFCWQACDLRSLRLFGHWTETKPQGAWELCSKLVHVFGSGSAIKDNGQVPFMGRNTSQPTFFNESLHSLQNLGRL